MTFLNPGYENPLVVHIEEQKISNNFLSIAQNGSSSLVLSFYKTHKASSDKVRCHSRIGNDDY